MMDPDRLLASLSRWVAPATLVVALVVGATLGLGPALLVLAGGTLAGVVFLLWSSLGRLTGESPLTIEEAIGLAAPSAEEERKRSVLRALKDLEYERDVGKISEEDFAELSLRYRAQAKALLRTIEEESAPLRQRAEARLAERLKKVGVTAGTRRSKSEKPPPAAGESAEGAKNEEASRPAAPVCAACSTPNDGDARFCKRCGAPLRAEGDA